MASSASGARPAMNWKTCCISGKTSQRTSTPAALARAALDFKEKGVLPVTAKRPELYRNTRGGHFLAHRDKHWRQAYMETLNSAPWQSVGKAAA